MSSYCNFEAQHCKDSCCDRQGNCPDQSGYSCYYFYTAASPTGFSGGAIAGVIIGGILIVVGIVILIICCNRRNAANRMQDAMANGLNRGVPIPPEQTTIVIQQNPQPYSYPVPYVEPIPMRDPYAQPNYQTPYAGYPQLS